jgi:transcriptional regulator with XRE-family HTH domain
MGSRVQNLNSTVSRMALWWYNNGMNNDKNDIAKVLADNIAYYRKKLNLTQLELAEKLNYSDKSISKWERAEGVPDIYVLKELSLFFGVPIDALVSKRKQPFSLLKNKFILAYFYASIFLVIGVALFGKLNLQFIVILQHRYGY